MMIKTDKEIALMTESAQRLKNVMATLLPLIRVGMTGRKLNIEAMKLIEAHDGICSFQGYGNPPFPAAICVSINDCVVHGIPDDRVFASGDIVGIDIGLIYQAFHSDMARTVIVGQASDKVTRLVRVTSDALDRAIDFIRPGITTGDLGSYIQTFVEKQKFNVVRDLVGHGIGRELHEKPKIPNYGQPGQGITLEAGMTIAVEPMVTEGDWHVIVADNGWDIITKDKQHAAHFEDTLVITSDGCTALTR